MAQNFNTIAKRSEKLGFTRPFVADLNTYDQTAGDRLRRFINENLHGSMDWMDDTLERRIHPQALWPDARSAMVLGMNYGPDQDPLLTLEQRSKATISVYARNRDYHDVMKGRLKEIAGLVAREYAADVKVFVDTAPLMEKPLAQAAGLGWQGKHTNLVSRDWGSWLFLGTILTTAELPVTPQEVDHCGSCRACLDICPTNAFPEPYRLDARKCISYLTIEHKGPVDLELRPKLGNRIYGCDDCLAVCPWNKFAETASEAKLQARTDLRAPDLATLARLGPDGFRAHFSGSPIKRIGWPRYLRNVLYAIGNSNDLALLSLAQSHLDSDDPVVKDAADWAFHRLQTQDAK